MKKKLIGAIIFVMVICFFPFISAEAYGVRCEYKLYYPLGLPELIGNGYTSYDDLDWGCEYAAANGSYESKQECLDFWNKKGEVTTIYIDSDPFDGGVMSCLASGDCEVRYLKNTKNVSGQALEAVLNTSVTDYMNASAFKYLPLELVDMSGWSIKAQDAAVCPSIYIGKYGTKLEVASNAKSVSEPLEIKASAKYYNTKEKGDNEDKWVPADEAGESEGISRDLTHNCDYTLIGAAELRDKNIQLGLNISRYQIKPYGGFEYDVTFSSNGSKKEFKNVLAPSEGKLDYYNIDFEVPGLGSDFNIYINNEVNGRLNLTESLNGLACVTDSEWYIVKIEDMGGKPTYEITNDDDYVEEKEEEYEDLIYDGGTIVTGCEVIPPEIRKWINNILKFVRYVALALVIALGALDFLKAAGSGEPDAMKKAGQSFMKRMIAVVILFLLPVIVDFILNMINIYGVDTNNIDCMKDPTK